MFFTAPRKSLFWTERQNSEDPIDNQTESSKNDNLLPPLSLDTSPLIQDALNSRTEHPNTRSSPYLRTLSSNPTDSAEFRNLLDSVSSSRKDLSALRAKSGSHSAGLPPSKNSSLWATVQIDSHAGDFGGAFKKREAPRLKTLESRRSYLLSSSTKNQKIMAVEEDEKEETGSLSEQDYCGLDSEDIESELSAYYEDEDEENLTPLRQLRRRQLRKILYAGYFAGIIVTMQNHMRLYGTLKPIEKIEKRNEELEVIKINKYLPLMPSDNLRVIWTLILAFFSFLTAIITPYIVSFINQENKTFEIINIVFDVVFGIDIIINFISAYYDPVHGLITDLKVIALKYLKGWFIIDFLAILPFDAILDLPASEEASAIDNVNKLLRLSQVPRLYKWFRLMRLFKMLKLFSTNRTFNRIIKKLNMNVEIIRMVKFIFNITILNHFVGCFWFFIAKMNDFDPETWVSKQGIIDEDAFTQYLISFSWALQTITTVGFGDIIPETPLERAVAILWMIMGVGMYSFTIEALSKLLANIDRRETALKKKISTFNNFASKAKIPNFLRQKVQRFFELNHKENIYYWIDPNNMFNYLPQGLKDTLFLYSYHPMIKNVPILGMNANFTAAILTHLKLLKLEKREILYRQDDPSEEVYFISKGSVKMMSEFGQGIYTLVKGTYFGEVEVLKDMKRLCFAQACETTVIIVCEKAVFMEALNTFPDIESKIKKVAIYREDKLRNTMNRLKEGLSPQKGNKKPLLKSSDYFSQILLTKPKKILGINQTFRPQRLAASESRTQTENSPLLPVNRSQDWKEEPKRRLSQMRMSRSQSLAPEEENKSQDTVPSKIISKEDQGNQLRKDIFKKKYGRTYTYTISEAQDNKDISNSLNSTAQLDLKNLLSTSIRPEKDWTISDGNTDFNADGNKTNDEMDPILKVQEPEETDEKLKYLRKVQEGLIEIRKLKEITENIFSKMDNKKGNIVAEFNAISERQIKVNANVERLFNLIK